MLVTITARIDTKVYSGPGTDFPIVGVLETGATATVLARNDDGSWWQINFLESTAWIADTVVTISAATDSVPVVTAPLSETKSSTPATLPNAGGGSWWLVGGVLLLLNGALLLLTGVRARRRGR